MQRFSEHVIGLAAEIAPRVFSKNDLSRVFVTVGLAKHMPRAAYSKGDLVSDTVVAALKQVHRGNTGDADALTRFATRIVERTADRDDAETNGSDFWQLREALRADGFDVQREFEPDDGDGWPPKSPQLLRTRILPLDDPAAPMTETITALEEDLRRLNLDVAANCHRQAVDALTEGRFESANGQLRALFEEVAAQAAVSTGYTRTKQGVGGNAITYLIKQGHLADPEGKYIQGLWGMTHTNGPHPGTTTAGEATFRMQAITTACRYLVDKFFN